MRLRILQLKPTSHDPNRTLCPQPIHGCCIWHAIQADREGLGPSQPLDRASRMSQGKGDIKWEDLDGDSFGGP